jgi:hypothetical protein
MFFDLKKLNIRITLLHPINTKTEIMVEISITPLENAYSLKKYVMEEFTKKPVSTALNVFNGESLLPE